MGGVPFVRSGIAQCDGRVGQPLARGVGDRAFEGSGRGGLTIGPNDE